MSLRIQISSLSKVIFSLSQASWDEPAQTVVMHRGAEPSLLQSLALQLADKVNYKITEPLHALSLADRCV